MKNIDLSWGNSVAVREAFLKNCSLQNKVLTKEDFLKMNYTFHDGDVDLITITKNIIHRQIGKTYRHVILTAGATGGVTIALRAFAQLGNSSCFTLPAPYFPLYPETISAAGLSHIQTSFLKPYGQGVALIDSPSNPKGVNIEVLPGLLNLPIIWDAVYANNVYTQGIVKDIPHDVLVGSYSKLTGINGIRLGFIATNNDILFQKIQSLVTAEYCGLSHIDMRTLVSLLKELNWKQFELDSRSNLNDNRSEWQKLERFFEETPVSPIGMFYFAKTDLACKKLLEKSGINYTSGKSCGVDDTYGRFNLGADPKLIKKAVKSVLKADKIVKTK